MRKPRGYVDPDAFTVIGCFFVIGLIATAFLFAWGLYAFVRWIC